MKLYGNYFFLIVGTCILDQTESVLFTSYFTSHLLKSLSSIELILRVVTQLTTSELKMYRVPGAELSF